MMALKHRLSDASNIRLDEEPDGTPVLEIEFKFIRYRLALDEAKMLESLMEILKEVTVIDDKESFADEPSMPNFYKKGADKI